MDDMEIDSKQSEQCKCCKDFGKDEEIWFICVLCGRWTNAECAEQDSATDYKCDFCRKKYSAKKNLVRNF